MTIGKAAKGVVTAGGGIYRIGFINDEGRDDETEFSAYNVKELTELYAVFCNENGFKTNTVTYIERV